MVLSYCSWHFRQSWTENGWQHETYPSLDPQGLPFWLLTAGNGDPVLVGADFARRCVAADPDLGSRRWVVFRCVCWTPTSLRTSTICGTLLDDSMEVIMSIASSNKRSWSVSAVDRKSVV